MSVTESTSPATSTVFGDVPPAAPGTAMPPDRPRRPGVATTLGIALLAAAVAISAVKSRENGDLDASNFVMGVLATLALLGIAAAARLVLDDPDRDGLVSWPGAVGTVGAGLLLAVLINSDDASIYTMSSVILAVSVVGYVASRGAPFVVSAILGLAVLYAKAFDDVISPAHGNGDNVFMVIGAGVLVFVVAVSAIGSFLPKARVVAAGVVGVSGGVSMVGLLAAITLARAFFAVSSLAFGPRAGGMPLRYHLAHDDPYKNDAWVLVAYCAVLIVMWLALAAATGHPVFRILVIGLASFALPAMVYAVAAGHPTWWEVVLAGLGVIALLGGAVSARRR